jgi:hypothetical protein
MFDNLAGIAAFAGGPPTEWAACRFAGHGS